MGSLGSYTLQKNVSVLTVQMACAVNIQTYDWLVIILVSHFLIPLVDHLFAQLELTHFSVVCMNNEIYN